MAELADYNFTIRYRPGKNHSDADVLSRMPLDFEDYIHSCTAESGQEAISAAMESLTVERIDPCRGSQVVHVSALSSVKDSETSEPLTPDQSSGRG